MRRYSIAVPLVAVGFLVATPIQAASAVAVGVSADGKLKYGLCYGGRTNPSEQEARNRAIGVCMASGCLNPRIVASTSRRGFGVIIKYQRSDGKIGYTASVGAATQQDAINDASRKAKTAGGSRAEVERAWNDIPRKVINL